MLPTLRALTLTGAAFVAVFATTALAEENTAAPPPYARADGDRVTVGFGLGAAPDYEGSNDYRLQPGGILQGKVSRVEFQMRGLNLYTDFVPDRGKTRLVLGPVVQLRLDRTGDIKDPRVAALGSRKTAVELGLTAGIGKRGFLIPPASLNFDVTYLHDVAGAHRSYVLTPAVSLSSPVSQRGFARLGLSADYVGKGYAKTYFDVALGGQLPAFATRGAGLKSVGSSLLYTHDLGGDPRKGLGLFALGNYKRLLGQFAESPIVRDAGSASQLFGVAGIAYSF